MPLYENPFSLNYTAQMTQSSAFTINGNITIVSSPALLSASQNPIIFEFASSATTFSQDNAQLAFECNAVPDSGNFFILSASSSTDFPTIQIVFAKTPGAGEVYSNETVPSKSVNELAECICSVLNGDFNFKQRFFAVRNGNEVNIQARQQGKRYNLNFISSDPDIQGISATNSSNWNRAQTLKDYSVYIDVYVNSSGTYADLTSRNASIKVGSVEIDYQKNNSYDFDVSSFVQPYCKTSIPTIGASTFQSDTGATTNVYCVFGELYDEFSNNFRKGFPIGQTSIVWVHNSALKYSEINNLSAYTVSSTTPLGTNRKFLTNSPSVKETYSNQKEFLSVIADGSSNFACGVRGTILYYDGSTSSYVNKLNTAFSTGGHKIADVSYSNLGFTGSTPIRKYTVQLYRDTVPQSNDIGVSEIKTYELLPDCPSDYQKNILWVNSLGGWDSFMFNGEMEQSSKRKSDIFITSPDYTPSETERLNTDYQIDVEFITTIKSSWINKNHFDWLFDLSKSDDVRVLQNNKFIPINIVKFDYQMDTIDDVYQVTIEYKTAIEENLNSNN